MPIQLRVAGTFITPGRVEEVGLGENLRLQVVSGLATGPKLFVVAGLHGDERLAVALAHEVAGSLDPKHLHGLVMLLPEAAPEAIQAKAHTLPGGADLDRLFPGSAKGTPAQRAAHLIFREVVTRCDFGVDLHAAPEGRVNLPHLSGHLENSHVRRLCESFGAPVIIDDPGPARSLRRTATEFGVPTITFEVGGAGRGERTALQEGVKGILGVMAGLKMVGGEVPWRGSPSIVRNASWIEAPREGKLDVVVQPGATLRTGDLIARIDGADAVTAPRPVLVLAVSAGRTAKAGEPVCHVATPVETNNQRNADVVS
jgi:hypothetical protein